MLCEDEATPNRNHEVLISALDHHSALPKPHAFFDRVSYLRTPDSICVVDYMIQPIFFSQFAKLVYFVWYSWSEAASRRGYR